MTYRTTSLALCAIFQASIVFWKLITQLIHTKFITLKLILYISNSSRRTWNFWHNGCSFSWRRRRRCVYLLLSYLFNMVQSYCKLWRDFHILVIMYTTFWEIVITDGFRIYRFVYMMNFLIDDLLFSHTPGETTVGLWDLFWVQTQWRCHD